MVFIKYIIAAVCVVALSIKASEYVDLLDQKTELSGAFIGGVMLSAVTSLPELFTSISSTLLIHKPELCIGNILGSDLFNLVIIATLLIFAFKPFKNAKVSKGHTIVTLCVLAGYVTILLNAKNILNFNILNVSITSFIIVGLYAYSFKYLAGESGGDTMNEDCESPLTVKQILVRFVIVSIGIILSSITITYITDEIAEVLHLGSGIAGAIFLGVATSLPELASTVSLFKMQNYDIAFGNIAGSNIFNLIILSVTDVLYREGGIYTMNDPKNYILLIGGIVASLAFVAFMNCKNRVVQFAMLVTILASYGAFLIL
ncbi:MAG: cation transporter [Erysipelotrichaceae bacterium]|nr:cation transporter [Erysipelotrichaceae bacterium]